MSKKFNADEFDFNAELEKINEKITKPSILVCGATGAGKSSFVNEVFGKQVAMVGNGKPITRGIRKYEEEDLSVVLYDSEGYEVGEERQKYFKDEIVGVIDKYRNENPMDISKHIHEVWYFISAANKRVTDTDIEVVNLIKEKNVPIAIAITQIDNVDMDELNDICIAVENNFNNIKYFTVCVTDNEEVREAVEPFNKKQELIDWAIDNLDETLKDGFVLSVNNNIEMVKNHINKVVIPSYVASAIATAAVPIPFADAAVLTPLQFTMSVHILKLYGIDKCKNTIVSIVQSTIISQIGKMLSKTLVGNIVKLIPGGGSIVGASINATIAGSITAAIGYAISDLSYRYSRAVLEGKNIDILDIFNSDMIKQAIKAFYKTGVQDV